jgi:hypothetical protein
MQIIEICKNQEPLPIISQETIAAHMAVLSSDEFQGRMPCSDGEDKTVAYLLDQMESLGLTPGY